MDIEYMLEAIEVKLEQFERTSKALSESLQKRGIQGNRVAHRFGCCAHDLLSFSFIFMDVHRSARAQIIEETSRTDGEFELSRAYTEKMIQGQVPSAEDFQMVQSIMSKRLDDFIGKIEGPVRARDEATRRLAVTYKAIYFFVRSFQDAAASALRVAYRQEPGRYTSMNKVLKTPKDSATAGLIEALPEYKTWFEQWKSTRDKVKEGTSFGIAGPGSNPGISFVEAKFESNGTHLVVNVQQAVRVSDIVGAITMCISLTDFIHSKLNAEQLAGAKFALLPTQP